MTDIKLIDDVRLNGGRRRLLQSGAVALIIGMVSQRQILASTPFGLPEENLNDPAGLRMVVSFRPPLARVAGNGFLVYEMNLANTSGAPLSLLGMQLLDARTGFVLAAFGASELPSMLERRDSELDQSILAPGERAVLYLSVPFAAGRAPASLRHRAMVARTGADRSPLVIIDKPIAIDTRPLPVLGPPLHGGPWTAVYDPAMERGHRRVIYTVDGRARIPGRFAIDWMRPNKGLTSSGHSDALGNDVLAVADGLIVAAHDGVPQPEPGEGRLDKARGDAAGNYIALALGKNRFAFYEHLMPGLRVRRGDRVRRGQAIARLGSTGEASEPHLHFHVSDAVSPLGAEGLPYELDGFRTLGAYTSIASFGAGDQWVSTDPFALKDADTGLPKAMAVVTFST